MSFYRERQIKSVRKARTCDGCGRKIEVGSPALDMSGHYDGDFWSQSQHIECRAAEVELNDLNDIRDGDEWLNLRDAMEADDWPWLVESHPIVAARMGITLERYREHEAERERVRAAWAEADRKRREPSNA